MSALSKISTLAQTVSYLKLRQITARLSHVYRRHFPVMVDWEGGVGAQAQSMAFAPSIPYADSYCGGIFEFLNLKKDFAGRIDWEYPGYGRLWTYNLNYFEFLNQKTIRKDEALALVNDFADNISERKTGMEPYPVSLRAMNWIKFFAVNGVSDGRLDSLLYTQLQILASNPEFHLLGNHLLENGFALLFGAYYFNDRKLYDNAKSILVPELDEQILPDGAHFELSPMYHSLMMLRVLDCYNLVTMNETLFGRELGRLLSEKGEKMLGWLNTISFADGNSPLFNDAAYGIAPSVAELNDYAARIGIAPRKTILKECGYRKFAKDSFEIIIDVGNIGPDYQPGHAHSDTLGFELHIHSRPVVVNTGTSTYQVDKNRFFERSTAAHNTVVVGGRNSSAVWGGHRVAQRARVVISEDTASSVSASHDGYRSIGVTHSRKFNVADEGILIKDELKGRGKDIEGEAYFHFHPSETIKIEDGRILGRDYEFSFEGTDVRIELTRQYYAPQFNVRIENSVARVLFKNELSTLIRTVNPKIKTQSDDKDDK